MRLPLFPFSTLVGVAALLAVAIGTFYVDGLQYTIPAFAPFLLVMTIAYIRSKGRIRVPQKSIAT
jgi:uncharacterized membrane protein YesL